MTEPNSEVYKILVLRDIFCVVSYNRQFRSGNDNLTIYVKVDRNFSAYIIEPISNTERHIFYEKTYIFNDTTYVLFFNTFVTFGVLYMYLPYFSADCPHGRLSASGKFCIEMGKTGQQITHTHG